MAQPSERLGTLPQQSATYGDRMARQRERLATRTGFEALVGPTTPADHSELHDAFGQIVSAGEGYPQSPGELVDYASFHKYWLAHATVSIVAREPDSSKLAGAYTMKPNGVGRAAHVANAGYFVVPAFRDRGVGEALVRHSLDMARSHGFDAMQFNFVFETNPARRLYERLGFEAVGRVPDVIDGEAVLIYWRKL